MSKTKILLIQIIGCIICGIIIGTAFWLFDGGKTCKKVSDCPGGVSNAQKMALENKIVKVYQGKWHKDYLEVIK